MVIVAVPPAPVVLFNAPPVANVTVTSEEEAVPTVHDPDAVMVMVKLTVHVSPGVVKDDGEMDPFVQFERTVISPAVPVVHAVA
jgi:hypothetical protein